MNYQYTKEASKDNKVYEYTRPTASEQKYSNDPKESKMPSWVKAVIIILAIALGLTMLTFGCTSGLSSYSSMFDTINQSSIGYYPDNDYIAIIYIEGTIDEDSTGTYNHQFILNTIDDLIDEEQNKGIILWMNTPGGTVYGSDEVYLKLKEYQDETNRPIYTSMQSTCASGGYYIGCVADQIYINRNGITGSIGVTMGQLLDISGLLEKYGIKVTSIVSGKNKAMGNIYEPATEEQIAIYQSIIDETYEQFVGIVSDERGIKLDEVKALADGRVYTPKQAVANGLVDCIGTFEECKEAMIKDCNLDSEIEFVSFRSYDNTYSLSSLFGKSSDNSNELSASELKKLLSMNGTFKLMYMSSLG